MADTAQVPIPQITTIDHAFAILFELFWAQIGVMAIWIVASLFLGIYHSFTKNKSSLSFFHPAYWFSTCFGLGKIPFVSGTWGSLFAVNLMMLFIALPKMGYIKQDTIFWLLAFATLLSTIAGIKSSDIYSKRALASTITGKSIAKDLKIVTSIMILVVGILSGMAASNIDKYDAMFREVEEKSIEVEVDIRSSDLSIVDSVVLPYYGYLYQNIYFWALLIITFIFCLRRIINSDKYAAKMDKADPSAVIIDEVSGQLITVSVCVIAFAVVMPFFYDPAVFYDSFRPLLYLFPFYMLLCFILFRVFDITKPLIIGKMDRNLKGGLGIMMDDVVAGLFAGILFIVLFLSMHYSGGFFWFYSEFLPEWIGVPKPLGEIK